MNLQLAEKYIKKHHTYRADKTQIYHTMKESFKFILNIPLIACFLILASCNNSDRNIVFLSTSRTNDYTNFIHQFYEKLLSETINPDSLLKSHCTDSLLWVLDTHRIYAEGEYFDYRYTYYDFYNESENDYHKIIDIKPLYRNWYYIKLGLSESAEEKNEINPEMMLYVQIKEDNGPKLDKLKDTKPNFKEYISDLPFIERLEFSDVCKKYDKEFSYYCFTSGLCKVHRDSKWGYITLYGEEFIPCKYDYIEDFEDEEFVKIQNNGKWGYLHYDKGEIIPCIFDNIKKENGILKVEKNNKWGIMDYYDNPEHVIYYDSIGICNRYKPIKVKRDNKYGVIYKQSWGNMEGQCFTCMETIPCIYDEIGDSLHNFLIPAKQGEKWGYITNKGEVYYDFQFDHASDFDQGGNAYVEINGRKGYFNKSSRVVSFFIYSKHYNSNPIPTKTCNICKGTGKIYQGAENCPSCGGLGYHNDILSIITDQSH